MMANLGGSALGHPYEEALALYEEFRESLYRLPESHPAYPHLRAAAVAAYCHWRDLVHSVTDQQALRIDAPDRPEQPHT